MGYYKNRVVIISGSEKNLKKARANAFKIYEKIFKDNFAKQCISPILGGYCNATYSFFISADGGNYLGETQINSEKARNIFIEYLKLNEIDYASLVFGGDDERKFFES